MANKLYEENDIQAIANAIRAKGPTGTMTVSQMAGKIADIPTGGGGSGPIDHGVVFIDYDGTTVDAWESEDVADKTALPSNPTREGYTSQGWNWTLADIKSYIASYPNAKLTVGQMYVWITPNDYTQSTKFYIALTKVTGLKATCKVSGSKSWGDGTSDSKTTHTYSDYGEYVITCDGTSIPQYVLGSTSSVADYTGIKVEIGKKVTSIGNNAFAYCNSLKSVTIPSSVTSIGSSAFASCYSLASIDIPSSVTSIGSSAFASCYSLTSVTIPNGITSIGDNAFTSCSALTSVTIPSSVTSFGTYAFSTCYSLQNIAIPIGTTSISDNMFASCYALQNITIPNGVTSIGTSAFSTCYSLASVDVPSGVTSIDDQAFRNCESLINVTIPSGVTSIGSNAFSGCYSLKNIAIPSSVTSIGSTAFFGCRSLTSVDIPSGVTTIEASTFGTCSVITRFGFTQHTSVPTLSATTAFQKINGICKIIVPDALYSSWIAATNWSTYADYIYKASEV